MRVIGKVYPMESGLRVVISNGLEKGEARLEQISGAIFLVVDSNDTLQALVLGLTTGPVGCRQVATQQLSLGT